MTITVNQVSDRVSSSFRDPSGFIFQRNGELFRQVNFSYKEDYDLLISSNLYERLTRKKMLVSHVEVDENISSSEAAYKILKPERVDFISYPYEWSFSQLRDAALHTLRIQKAAIDRGMILKDASAFNIQYHNGTPILIDSLSFTKYVEGAPWVAYRQFCQHFLAPLALMSYVDVRFGKLLQLHIDGIPLDLASKLLPLRSWINFSFLTHIHLHARAQQRYSKNETERRVEKARISKMSLIALIENLEKTVKRFKWKPSGTEWAEYYDATNYSEDSFEDKKRIVKDLFFELKPQKIWDLGANTGVFSRLGKDLDDCQIISTDIDPGAVEINYIENRKIKSKNILPLIVDLTNPSAAIGWNNDERQSFFQRGPVDVIMALALVHHLAIGNNVPLGDISKLMASLGRFLIIEFVPKEDSQVKRMLASRDDIFQDYTIEGFIRAFSKDFKLRKQIPVGGSTRTVFLFERK
jgi:hypothetical protein